MKMIIGGACQGKKTWAREHFSEITDWIDGNVCSEEELMASKGVYHFHEYIRRSLKEDSEHIDELAEKLIEKNPDLVIVTTEIGCGLVPIDAFEREYREKAGRICTELASFSEFVVRISMGIGVAIKGL